MILPTHKSVSLQGIPSMYSAGSFLAIGIVDVGGIARSGNSVGYDIYTIDYFGDMDVKSFSKKSLSVIDEYGHRKEDKTVLSEKLLKLVKKLINENKIDFVLLSSGLDDDFDFLYNLNELIPIMGNDPGVFKAVRDKENFFQSLKQIGLLFPRTCIVKNFYEGLHAARDIGFPIILKPLSGFGGLGVKKIVDKKELKKFFKMELKEPYLVQEYISGIPASISLLADGTRTQILTINEQLLGMREFGQSEEFVYCGNVIPFDTSDEKKKECEKIASRITDHFRLKGSNGIDIVFSNQKEEIYVIEVNPRFQGTLECSEKFLNLNLINLHEKACLNRELKKHYNPPGSIFYTRAILYAKNNLIAPDLSNYDFVRDVPHPGFKINRGEPICSILSCSMDREKCLEKVELLAENIYNKKIG